MDIFLYRKSWEICGRILFYGLKSKFKIPKDGSADIHIHQESFILRSISSYSAIKLRLPAYLDWGGG